MPQSLGRGRRGKGVAYASRDEVGWLDAEVAVRHDPVHDLLVGNRCEQRRVDVGLGRLDRDLRDGGLVQLFEERGHPRAAAGGPIA